MPAWCWCQPFSKSDNISIKHSEPSRRQVGLFILYSGVPRKVPRILSTCTHPCNLTLNQDPPSTAEYWHSWIQNVTFSRLLFSSANLLYLLRSHNFTQKLLSISNLQGCLGTISELVHLRRNHSLDPKGWRVFCESPVRGVSLFALPTSARSQD